MSSVSAQTGELRGGGSNHANGHARCDAANRRLVVANSDGRSNSNAGSVHNNPHRAVAVDWRGVAHVHANAASAAFNVDPAVDDEGRAVGVVRHARGSSHRMRWDRARARVCAVGWLLRRARGERVRNARPLSFRESGARKAPMTVRRRTEEPWE